MRILAINNYSLDKCLEKVSRGVYPKHHLWGIDYLRDRGHEIKTELYHVPDLHLQGKLHSLFNWIYQFWFCLSIAVRKDRYDAIICFAHPIAGFLPLMRKIGLIQSKLYTFVHHHRQRITLLNGWDYCFFISQSIMNLSKFSRGGTISWGPDLSFYEDTFIKMEALRNELIQSRCLISNGKTMRDLELIDTACCEMHIPLVIITDNYNTHYATVYISGKKDQNAISDLDNLKLCSKSLICVIPIVKEKPIGMLSGLTSVLDALALGMPLLISDNTNIGLDVESLQLGKIYKTGDKEDFKQKVSELLSDPIALKQYSQNARRFAICHSYINYCRQLAKVIENDVV